LTPQSCWTVDDGQEYEVGYDSSIGTGAAYRGRDRRAVGGRRWEVVVILIVKMAAVTPKQQHCAIFQGKGCANHAK
jgi:hypothetical protein